MRARTAAVRYVRDKSAPNEASSHSAHFDRFLHQHRVLAEVGALAERAANDLVVHNHVDLFLLAEGRIGKEEAAHLALSNDEHFVAQEAALVHVLPLHHCECSSEKSVYKKGTTQPCVGLSLVTSRLTQSSPISRRNGTCPIKSCEKPLGLF